MFIVDTDVIDAHVENLMESLHFPTGFPQSLEYV